MVAQKTGRWSLWIKNVKYLSRRCGGNSINTVGVIVNAEFIANLPLSIIAREIDKRLSCRRRTIGWNLLSRCTTTMKNRIWKELQMDGEWPWKALRSSETALFKLVDSSNSVSMNRNIAYMTVCDLEKSLRFDTAVRIIINHIRFPRRTSTHSGHRFSKVWELQRFQTVDCDLHGHSRSLLSVTFDRQNYDLHRNACSSFDKIPACDRRTDRQTDGHQTIAYAALTQRSEENIGQCSGTFWLTVSRGQFLSHPV